MLPEFFAGLPLHALVIHAVVVLLPLSALGTIVIAVWPAARQRYGWLVVGAAAVATISVQVAASSGENLKSRVGSTPQIERHQELGEQMIWYAIPMFVLAAAVMVVHEINRRQAVSWAKLATVAAAVLAIGASVAAGIHVVRVGDAGSRSVWEFVKDQPPR